MGRTKNTNKDVSVLNGNDTKGTVLGIGKVFCGVENISIKLGLKQANPMRILALDVATHCGYAISQELYGVWNLTPRRDESAGMRLLRLRSKLNEVIKSECINLVVFERPGGQHKGAIIVQSELQGQIKVVCEDNFVEYRGYSSQEIKKFATGKGNAGKPAMIAAAKKAYGYLGNDDNEADALHLLELAKSEYK